MRTIGRAGDGLRLEITTRLCGPGLTIGESLAVNGCCLTVTTTRTEAEDEVVGADVLMETWSRTNLQFCRAGSAVNLERPLRADGRWGGHFVTGHVDGTGRVASWKRSGADRLLRVAAPPELLRYIVAKGSVAVDGISLTVAEVLEEGFGVWIIPHTFEKTALSEREEGEAVNLEGDLLGKYAEKFLQARSAEGGGRGPDGSAA